MNPGNEMLVGFIEGAREYLPKIHTALDECVDSPQSAEALNKAYRLAQSLRGASQMVDLPPFEELTNHLSEGLGLMEAGGVALDAESVEVLRKNLDLMDRYLDQALAGEGADSALLTEVSRLPTKSTPVSATLPRPIRLPEPIRETFKEEDLGEELLNGFFEEAGDHLEAVAEGLEALREEAANRAALQRVRRRIHTLKGAAGMVGHEAIGRLSHRMEDLLDRLWDQSLEVTPQILALSFATLDQLSSLASGNVATALLDSLYAQYDDILGAELEAKEQTADEEESTALPGAESRELKVRVPASALVSMVDHAKSIVGIYKELQQVRSALEPQAVTAQKSAHAISRIGMLLGTSLEEIEHIAGEAISPLHSLIDDLVATGRDLFRLDAELRRIDNSLAAPLVQTHVLGASLRGVLENLQRIPFGNLQTRLERAVRTVAEAQGKTVEFSLEGGDQEIDQALLDKIVDPLLHLVRNAVDHGIEISALRQVIGKDAAGKITVRALLDEEAFLIEVADDGAGLEADILRATAVAGSHIPENEAASLSHEDLHQLLFLPGFTTADEVDKFSGRGVGLDVVKANLEKIGGGVSVRSIPGSGTTFHLRLPSSIQQ